MKLIALRVSDSEYEFLCRKCDISGYIRSLIAKNMRKKVMVISDARKDREEPHGSGGRNRLEKEHAEQ